VEHAIVQSETGMLKNYNTTYYKILSKFTWQLQLLVS